MARTSNLKPGEKVIYYGYEIPRRRGDTCLVYRIYEEDVAVIFQSDKCFHLCPAKYLKKVDENA